MSEDRLNEQLGVRLDEASLTYPATVLALNPADALAVINERHALEPDVVTEANAFFWGAEISNSRRDSYDTRMDVATTLPNYAADARTGVSFCDSHRHDSLAFVFGRSFSGDLLEAEGENPRVVAAFYTLRGLQAANGQTTDDLILKMRAGIIKDVSVGFKPGDGFMYRCSICGLDMLRDWDCPHIPGVTYKVPAGDDSGDLVERVAIAWIVGARLSEVSGAYDGSTPNAMILKARLEIAEGRMKPDVHRLLTTRYRLQLPDLRLQVGASTKGDAMAENANNGGGSSTGAPQTEQTRAASTAAGGDMLALVRAAVTAAGIQPEGGVEKITAVGDGVRLLQDEITRLRPLATDGETYRTNTVNEAVAAGVKAGLITEGEAETAQRASLAQLPIATVIATRTAWLAIAEKRFPGGRASADSVDNVTTGEEDEGGGNGGGNTVVTTNTRTAPDTAFERV